MDTTKRSDSHIIASVAREYMWKVPSTRRLLLPVAMLMVVSRYCAVQTSDFYREISKALKDDTGLPMALLKYSMFYISSVVLTELQALIICQAGQIAYRRANKEAYRFFLELDPESFRRFGKGEIQNIIDRRSRAVQDIIDVFTLNFIPCALTVFFVAYHVAANMGTTPMLIILFCIHVYAISTVKITVWRNTIRQKINRQSNKTSNIQMDGLMNYETVLIHNNSEYEVARYDKSLSSLEESNTGLARSLYLLNLVQLGIWCIQTIVIITISTLGISVRKIEPENLTFFVGVVATLVVSLNNLGFMYGKYKQAMINMRLDVTSEVIQMNEGGGMLSRFEDKVVFEDIAVTLGDREILRGVNLEVSRGEKIAVIGENGAGKSTLIKILLYLQKPTRGRVTIDGYDIGKLKASSLRSIMAYVPQNASMFNESVLYNVRYARPEMTEDEVVKLGKDLGLHDTIARLEHGYHTNVCEQGTSLSGGERQKIAIMRALAAGGSILVMDEPTANLDKNAESDILTKLTSMKDLTLVSIVHNWNLLRLFDRVFIVAHKTVTERDPRKDIPGY